MTRSTNVMCPHCKGNGNYTSQEGLGKCGTCKGTGEVTPQVARAYSNRVHKEMMAFNKKIKRG